MALLQDPLKVLTQIEQYLQSPSPDAFPGARILAAGNLCRQVVEQLAFLLCVYGGVPRQNFLKGDGRLKLLSQVLVALDRKDPGAKQTYWTLARKRGPRIAKLALKAKLNRWRDWFNEPSHYSAPGHMRRIGEPHIREFVRDLRVTLDGRDFGLIVAAYNQVMSNGLLRADLAKDLPNTPAIHQEHVVRIRDLHMSNGSLAVSMARSVPFQVLPADAERRPRKLTGPAMVAGETVPILTGRFVNENGTPIDLTNRGTILRSLIPTRRDALRLQRRVRRLGLRLQINRKPGLPDPERGIF